MSKIGNFLLKNKSVIAVILILVIITISTNYYGSTDTGDYSDSAKYFSGKYDAKIRNSHSYLFGYLHYPYIKFFDNFLIFKITSVLFLILIVISVYHISKKNKMALWLTLLSPVIWYMAPWINPIQLTSLMLLYQNMIKLIK